MKCSQGSSILKRPLSGCTVVLLVAALFSIKGYAKPTISTNNNLRISQPGSSSIIKMTGAIDFLSNGDSNLLNIGSEIAKPRTVLKGSAGAYEHHIEPLPAVPAAVIMVAVGFICISLVRDRRVWMMTLSAIFCAGNAGLYAVPQLAKNIYNKAHSQKHLPVVTAKQSLLKSNFRERCDIEGTGYIALINYLEGLPDANITPQIQRSKPPSLLRQDRDKYRKTLFEIICSPYNYNSLISKIVSTEEAFIRLLPAFIFNCLARGPPVISPYISKRLRF